MDSDAAVDEILDVFREEIAAMKAEYAVTMIEAISALESQRQELISQRRVIERYQELRRRDRNLHDEIKWLRDHYRRNIEELERTLKTRPMKRGLILAIRTATARGRRDLLESFRRS